MEYTEGNWRYCQANKEIGCSCGLVWNIEIDRVMAQVIEKDEDGSIPHNQMVANAQLISAAPDLYEALRYLLDFLGMPTDKWVAQYGAGVTQKQACDKARKAIAKAESE